MIQKVQNASTTDGVYSEVAQFLRSYAGPKSEFLASIKDFYPRNYSREYTAQYLSDILVSFGDYVKEGLLEELSPTRKAQIDVVSDFLEQANLFLNSTSVHPAAPAVLIGASLEEFLRNWIEETGLSISNKKPSLDAYAKVLREESLITKQDVKDITSWEGCEIMQHMANGIRYQIKIEYL